MVKSYTFREVKQISCKRGEIVQKPARCQNFRQNEEEYEN